MDAISASYILENMPLFHWGNERAMRELYRQAKMELKKARHEEFVKDGEENREEIRLQVSDNNLT